MSQVEETGTKILLGQKGLRKKTGVPVAIGGAWAKKRELDGTFEEASALIRAA